MSLAALAIERLAQLAEVTLVPCHAGIAQGVFAPRQPVEREARRLALMSWERFDRAYVPLNAPEATTRSEMLAAALRDAGAPSALGDEVAAVFADGCVALLDWSEFKLDETGPLDAWREAITATG